MRYIIVKYAFQFADENNSFPPGTWSEGDATAGYTMQTIGHPGPTVYTDLSVAEKVLIRAHAFNPSASYGIIDLDNQKYIPINLEN